VRISCKPNNKLRALVYGGIVVYDQYGTHARMVAGVDEESHPPVAAMIKPRGSPAAGGMEAAFNAGHSTEACPNSITTTAPISA